MTIRKVNLQVAIPFLEVFAKIISFINILLMMKFLSMDSYADYAYIVAIVLWASFVMDGGINNMVFNKSLQKDLKDVDQLFTSKLILSFAVVTVLILFFTLRKPQLAVSAVLFSFVMIFNMLNVFIKMIARGEKIYTVDASTIVSEPLLRLFIFLICYFFIQNTDWHLWVFMVIYLIAGILSFFINFKAIGSYFKIHFLIYNLKAALYKITPTLKSTKYFLFYSVLYTGITKIDIIFMEKFALKKDLALFSSAMTIYEVILLFFFTISTSHFKEIYTNPKKASLLGISASVLTILGTLVLSDIVLKIILPVKYFDSYTVVNYLIFGVFPSIFVFYFIYKLNYENKTKVNFIILLSVLIFKIGIYTILKPSELSAYKLIFPSVEYVTFICYLVYLLVIDQKKANLSMG